MAEFLEGIEGYDEVEINTGNKPKDIVPGGYILKVKDAKIARFSAGSVAIKLAFDIEEGEFKGYYSHLYNYNKSGQYSENARWKGVYNIFYPSSSDPEQKKREIASFKRTITAFNDSNKAQIDPTKKFSLDAFKGKLVGGVFGLSDWEWNGKNGTKCECRWLIGVERVRSGEFELPKHKGVNGKVPEASKLGTSSTAQSSLVSDFVEIISEGDIPF